MTSYIARFVFKNKVNYKDLVPSFPEILNIVLEENDHFQGDEGEEQRNMFLEMNLSDLRINRKPEGYNRKGSYRLIFPIGSMEFYVSMHGVKPKDVTRVTARVEDALTSQDKPKLKFEIIQETVND